MLIGISCFIIGMFVVVVGFTVFSIIYAAKEEMKEAVSLKKQLEEDATKQQAQLKQILVDSISQRQAALQRSQIVASANTATAAAADSVKERLKKAVDLTARQSKIDTRLGPNFQLAYNDLELAKLAVLKTILADGFDPTITIRYNTGDEEMTLSAYVSSVQKGLI